MTSQDLRKDFQKHKDAEWAQAYTLKEIAYQLAVFNERNDAPKAKHGDMPPRPADPVSAADFAADVLRSCANHIAKSKIEPEVAALYLLATANELATRPQCLTIPGMYRAKLSRQKDT